MDHMKTYPLQEQSMRIWEMTIKTINWALTLLWCPQNTKLTYKVNNIIKLVLRYNCNVLCSWYENKGDNFNKRLSDIYIYIRVLDYLITR